MKKVAVLGGTRYVGRRVVEGLLEDGVEVTLVTRGLSPDPFGDAVIRKNADVSSAQGLKDALTRSDGDGFDAVLHQIAYNPIHARNLLAATAGRTRRLIVTSTIEVYNPESLRDASPTIAAATSSPHTEESLDLTAYPTTESAPWSDPAYLEEHYGEGKRQVESLVLRAPVSAVTVRLAHVLAPDDPTGRLRMLVDHVRSGTPIVAHGDPGATSFVHADQAAAALIAVMGDDVTGPVNLAAPEPTNTLELVSAIGAAAGVAPVVVVRDEPAGAEHASPFTYPFDFVMDTRRLHPIVGDLDPVGAWLPDTLAPFFD